MKKEVELGEASLLMCAQRLCIRVEIEIPIHHALLNTILAWIWPGAQPDHHFHRHQTL